MPINIVNHGMKNDREVTMKIGLHLSMLCKNWTDDTSVYLEELKREGFQGVEISLYGTTPDRLTKVFSKANSLGLNIFCGTGVDGEHDPSSEEPNIRKNAFSDIPKEKRWENSAQVLREAAEYGAEKGIDLHVEVINRFESDFMNTLEEGAAFLEKVNHAHVKLLVDTFHMNIEEDNMFTSIKKYISKIGCIHICENHRGVPGTGHIDWKQLIETLEEVGYDGFLEMETFTEKGTEVARGMGIWRQIGKETPLEEAKKGIHFLKKTMKQEV